MEWSSGFDAGQLLEIQAKYLRLVAACYTPCIQRSHSVEDRSPPPAPVLKNPFDEVPVKVNSKPFEDLLQEKLQEKHPDNTAQKVQETSRTPEKAEKHPFLHRSSKSVVFRQPVIERKPKKPYEGLLKAKDEEIRRLKVEIRGLKKRKDASVVESTQYKNGTTRILYSDNHCVLYYSNGDVKEVYPDGVSVYTFSSACTVQTSFPNGSQLFAFPNGQLEQHYPDGAKEIRYPDGTSKKVYANHTEEIKYPNGAVKKVRRR